ncbi:MAG: hypothetical protein KFB93_01285 [Simkaniaceae bacterium]|nr:MAG: hypothetical protein KFB93_01285 [Simkaniaceae bacterium]
MFPTIISFYTENTPYEKEIEGLVSSCEKFNLPYSVDPMPNFGSWEKNCCFKPKYIQKKLFDLQKPVLWLDADAIVYQKPLLFETLEADVALHSNPLLPDNHPSKVNSGTLLFYPTSAAFSLLEKWDQETERLLAVDPEPWDQISLRNVLFQTDVNVHFLDSRYCRIFTKIKDDDELKSSFFIHFQASRTLKKTLNQEVVPFWDEQTHIEQKKAELLGFNQ